MMTEFRIRRGPASDLFEDISLGALERKINPNLRIEVGCWYLTSDTAELFLGIKLEDGSKNLKRINGESTLDAISKMQKELEQLAAAYTYTAGNGLLLKSNEFTVDTSVIATTKSVADTARELRDYVNNQILTGGTGILDCGEV